MNYYKIEKLDRENVRMLVKVCTSEELKELQLTFKPDCRASNYCFNKLHY